MDMAGGNDERFLEVETGTFLRNECSPTLEEDRLGVAIAAPESARFLDDPLQESSFVICGAYRVDSADVPSGKDPADTLVLVAVDEPGAVYSSRAGDPDSPAEPDDDQGPAPSSAGGEYVVSLADADRVIEGGYFNLDAVEVLSLPPKSATYVVYVTLGHHKSNALRVRLEAP